MATSRRGVIKTLAAAPALFLGGLDEDGDGKVLDDVLGLDEDRFGDHIPEFVARDTEDAERIDPPTDPPYRVTVLSGRLQGTHIVTEDDS